MALKGHGATVRYVTLPHESHGYAARESNMHVIKRKRVPAPAPSRWSYSGGRVFRTRRARWLTLSSAATRCVLVTCPFSMGRTERLGLELNLRGNEGIAGKHDFEHLVANPWADTWKWM